MDIVRHPSGSIPWFFRLRWCAFVGQSLLVTTLIAGFGVLLPLAPLLSVLAILCFSNVALGILYRDSQVPDGIVGGTLLLDTALLTVMLAVSGGAMNPFTIIYLVHVVLAAVMLGVRWTWIVAGAAAICFASLFLLSTPVFELGHHAHASGFSMHLHGMLGAFLIAAGLTALFLTRIVAEHRARERTLERFAASQERLATLTALAASAAHELGTPLTTIAIIVGDLQEQIDVGFTPESAHEDLRLVQEQLERCKAAVSELVASAGGIMGELSEEVPGAVLFDLATRPLSRGVDRITASPDFLNASFMVPQRAFAHALRMLLKNSIDAGSQEVRIELEATERGMYRLVVRDSGSGIAPEILPRMGEPFMSTKGEGRGLGLGVFIARLVADRLKGSLQFKSALGVGTEAAFVLPANLLRN